MERKQFLDAQNVWPGKIVYGKTSEKCTCGEKMKPAQINLMKKGKILIDFEDVSDIRANVLNLIKKVEF